MMVSEEIITLFDPIDRREHKPVPTPSSQPTTRTRFEQEVFSRQ